MLFRQPLRVHLFNSVLDLLLGSPIYNPDRCSITFHPLHSFWAIGIYVLLCFPKQARLVGIGLVIHMALDSLDCQITNGVWCTASAIWIS